MSLRNRKRRHDHEEREKENFPGFSSLPKRQRVTVSHQVQQHWEHHRPSMFIVLFDYGGWILDNF